MLMVFLKNVEVHMDGYMTIGEVAKVKQISIKALRYYEKIGILKPAYCAPDTGYRYYKNEQMLAIDMIKFLQILDIPLKNWNQYVEPTGEFDLKGLLRDGQIRAYEKIGELQSCLKRLQLAERGIQDTEKYRDCDGFYRREIPERNILRREIKEGLSSVEFHKKLSELFELAQKHQLSANYPSGMMLDVEDGTFTYFVYVEVYEKCEELPEYKCIPAGTYECLRCPPKSIMRAAELYPEYFAKHAKFTVVESDCITSPVYFQEYPVELQLTNLY